MHTPTTSPAPPPALLAMHAVQVSIPPSRLSSPQGQLICALIEASRKNHFGFTTWLCYSGYWMGTGLVGILYAGNWFGTTEWPTKGLQMSVGGPACALGVLCMPHAMPHLSFRVYACWAHSRSAGGELHPASMVTACLNAVTCILPPADTKSASLGRMQASALAFGRYMHHIWSA
jgi:hypothetical protein